LKDTLLARDIKILFVLCKPSSQLHNAPPFFRILNHMKPFHVLTSHLFKIQFNLVRFYAYVLHVVPFFQRFLSKFFVHLIFAACRLVHAGNKRPAFYHLNMTRLQRQSSQIPLLFLDRLVSIRHTSLLMNRTFYHATCRHIIKSLHCNLNTV
jgi:hypothetical protein